MDSFLLMLSVALGALCAVLLLKIAFGEKREETDTAALEAAIRDALDRNSDVAEARHNRLEMRLTQANSLNREGMEAVRRESLDLIPEGVGEPGSPPHLDGVVARCRDQRGKRNGVPETHRASGAERREA